MDQNFPAALKNHSTRKFLHYLVKMIVLITDTWLSRTDLAKDREVTSIEDSAHWKHMMSVDDDR